MRMRPWQSRFGTIAMEGMLGMEFDLAMTDMLLTTTRAVRKRLDFGRPVSRETILECLEIAVQAPSGGNRQTWRWLIVDDPLQKAALAEFYRRGMASYENPGTRDSSTSRSNLNAAVRSGAEWLAEHLDKVPALVIPCLEGRPSARMSDAQVSSYYGSIFPAIWSFQLALRSRGLGSTITTVHLMHEDGVAQLLGIPANIKQVAMLPVAYTKGTDFKQAARPPLAEITHWNRW
jgi:nitroreductase